MEEYIDFWVRHFKKAQQKGNLEGNIIFAEEKCPNEYPPAVNVFFSCISEIRIVKPRVFEIYWPKPDIWENRRFVLCAKLGDVKLYFDTLKLNCAGEWDIVNTENGYVVTHTMASFLTNKAWAWIERGRRVWEKE